MSFSVDKFSRLGNDVNRNIASFLNCESVVASTSVSKTFKQIMEDSVIWRNISANPLLQINDNFNIDKLKHKLKCIKFYNRFFLQQLKKEPGNKEDLLSTQSEIDTLIHEQDFKLKSFFQFIDTDRNYVLIPGTFALIDKYDPNQNDCYLILQRSITILERLFKGGIWESNRNIAMGSLSLFLKILPYNFKVDGNLFNEFIRYIEYSMGYNSSDYNEKRNKPFSKHNYEIFKILLQYILTLYSEEDKKRILHDLLIKLCYEVDDPNTRYEDSDNYEARVHFASLLLNGHSLKDIVKKNQFISLILNTQLVELTDNDIYQAIFRKDAKTLKLFLDHQKFEKKKLEIFLKVCDFAHVHYKILNENFDAYFDLRSVITSHLEQDNKSEAAEVTIKDTDIIGLSIEFGTTSLAIDDWRKIDLTLVDQWIRRFRKSDFESSWELFMEWSHLLSESDQDRVFNEVLAEQDNNSDRYKTLSAFLDEGYNLSFDNLKMLLKLYLKDPTTDNIILLVVPNLKFELKQLALQDMEIWEKSDDVQRRPIYSKLRSLLIYSKAEEEGCCVIS